MERLSEVEAVMILKKQQATGQNPDLKIPQSNFTKLVPIE